METGIIYVKLGCAAALVIANILGGFAPFMCTRGAWFTRAGRKKSETLSVLITFTGSMLLSASLLLLLPDAVELLAEWSADIGFPLAYAMCGAGFTTVLFLQSGVQLAPLGGGTKEESDRYVTQLSNGIPQRVPLKDYNTNGVEEEEETDHRFSLTDEPQKPEESGDVMLNTFSPLLEPQKKRKLIEKKQEDEEEPEPTSLTSGYVLFAVVSAESFISGLSLGMMDTLKAVLFLFFALGAHDWAEAMAVSVELLRSGLRKSRATFFILLSSIMVAVGILVGIVFIDIYQLRYELAFTGLFLAYASGIFLYLSIVEMIMKEIFSPPLPEFSPLPEDFKPTCFHRVRLRVLDWATRRACFLKKLVVVFGFLFSSSLVVSL